MLTRQRFDEYRRRIKFADLDLASRTMAVLWLGIFKDRVIRNCFPRVASQSLIQEVTEVINSTFLEGYILARAAEDRGDAGLIYSDPNRRASVEAGVEKLRMMYEEETGGGIPFAGESPLVESLAESLVREIVYGPRLIMLEERELLKVHLMYSLWAGYRLALFERRLSGEGS
jgi:hypothetical protein